MKIRNNVLNETLCRAFTNFKIQFFSFKNSVKTINIAVDWKTWTTMFDEKRKCFKKCWTYFLAKAAKKSGCECPFIFKGHHFKKGNAKLHAPICKIYAKCIRKGLFK